MKTPSNSRGIKKNPPRSLEAAFQEAENQLDTDQKRLQHAAHTAEASVRLKQWLEQLQKHLAAAAEGQPAPRRPLRVPTRLDSFHHLKQIHDLLSNRLAELEKTWDPALAHRSMNQLEHICTLIIGFEKKSPKPLAQLYLRMFALQMERLRALGRGKAWTATVPASKTPVAMPAPTLVSVSIPQVEALPVIAPIPVVQPINKMIAGTTTSHSTRVLFQLAWSRLYSWLTYTHVDKTFDWDE